MSAQKRCRPEVFNVVGYVTANLGLGVAARNTISRLVAAGNRVHIVDIDPGGRVIGRDDTCAHLEVATRSTACAVNVFHLNPPEALGHSVRWVKRLNVRTSLNVCVPFWEMPSLPPQWVPFLECMDYVLAPTRFVEQACLAALPAERVVYYPQTISLPPEVASDRKRWGIAEDAVSFLVTFDINSDVHRKNPWGAIDAFQRAFPGTHGVQLVMRVNGEPKTKITREQLQRLLEAAESDSRILIVRGALSYPEVLSLYRSCDVLVSLHRSEGLGLHLMEAMWMGLPVVATGWSGNMDFMDATSSCLVPADFVPVRATHESYAPEIIGPDQYWAEPDVDEAARCMRHLFDDPVHRRALGERGKVRLQEYLTAAAQDNALENLAEIDVLETRRSPDSRRRQQRLRRLLREHSGRRGVVESGKHAIVVILRAIGLYPPAPEHEHG